MMRLICHGTGGFLFFVSFQKLPRIGFEGRRRIHMSLTELFIIAVGLSMDAFAVSVCKGLSVQKRRNVILRPL